jgi:hypothetical protein
MSCVYIHTVTQWSDTLDLKNIITDANTRRRMSRMVKMGVTAGLKCWNNASLCASNTAIITATQYGCLSDSEKFLSQMIANQETNLSPTPFIQSTFNTIGAQIALIKSCKEYNMTYVNRANSLYDAYIDAYMLARDGKNVLLGYIDEVTPTLLNVASRMRGVPTFDGAIFMVVSADKPSKTYIEIPEPDLQKPLTNAEFIALIGCNIPTLC